MIITMEYATCCNEWKTQSAILREDVQTEDLRYTLEEILSADDSISQSDEGIFTDQNGSEIYNPNWPDSYLWRISVGDYDYAVYEIADDLPVYLKP